ncbi:hypothetical protein SCLCIDRAFT_212811 [Scleroderma citrinum Foug A]|uniref:Uncharacterized protein n=1 Tax=Scleroderma citrinum Foug A TaxID=1036808 RepID=A0A0C3APR4_9AGAM|nr:hypothetical protein SCLCIDRAFT_212811 [Scleroderma citrinum Foug A]
MPHILARNPSGYSSNLIDSRPNHTVFTRESQYLHSTDVRECSPVDGEAPLCYTSGVGTSQDRWGPRPQQVSLAMCHYVPILAAIALLETLSPLWLNHFFGNGLAFPFRICNPPLSTLLGLHCSVDKVLFW